MLSAFEKVNGISLLDGTKVNEADILAVVYKFTEFAISSGEGVRLIDFFNGKKNVSNRTIKALALIGLKHVVDEYTELVKNDPHYARYAEACADFVEPEKDDEETAQG